MVQEGQLLVHQRTVDVMLTLDLGRAGRAARALRVARLATDGSISRSSSAERDRAGIDAQPQTGPLEQPGALGSIIARRCNSAWSRPVVATTCVDLAGPDRDALLEHDLQQAAGGDQLAVEMVQDIVGEESSAGHDQTAGISA